MDLENWDDLKFVLAMSRHGTMSAAARYLDTNVATVSRRIERLSSDLETPLFEKRGQAFVATPVAERLAKTAEEFDQTLRRELGRIQAGHATGTVHLDVAAPPAVHQAFTLPNMGDLATVMPNVNLTLTDKVFAQGLGAADIQVRIGRPEGGRLKARKFCDYTLRVYHGRDHQLNGQWIGMSQRYPDHEILRKMYPDALETPRYRVEEMTLVYHMVKATGLPGALPDFMVRPEDDLVTADLPDNELGSELWITYHETRQSDDTLRAVVDWLCRIPTAG